MSAAPQKPKHPKAGLYLQYKLFHGISRFAELEQRIANLPTKQERGDAFEVFTEAYLSTQPLYQAKTVWPFSALPLAIRERFALGQSDVGVDGVLETHLGEFHAYQAKFRTGRPSLTWDELSTFMGLTDQIAERVVITNCNELSDVVTDRRGFYAVRGTDLDRLQAEDFEAICHWLAGAVVEHKRKIPLPRQQDALDAIEQTLKEQDRATILMPCGTGKTLVALWAAEQLGGQKILVLVPSLALVSQTLHEWLKETQWSKPSFLCVCSDPTVTSRAEDTVVLHQADVDFPVTTESEAVRSFLEQTTDGVKVIFSTYQSARVVASGITEKMRFDFGIFDEAHKTAGGEGAQFGFALKDENLPISKRLCMTATPRHYDVSKRDKEGEAKLVYSMDVPEVYGPVAYRLSFAQAVEDKMICGYKVLISVVTSEMVNDELLRRGAVLVEQDLVKARQVANELAVKDAIERYGIGKVITFHKSVAAAASFTASGPEGIVAHVPGLTAFHVNGTMASGTRDPIMRAFAEGERTLISNARCLTEGVDVPAVDMVAFLTPKRSLVDIVQATGRAMRKSDATHKTTGYVLVPLFLEYVAGESIEEAVARAEFDEIWAVLQALQEHDEVLAEIISRMREDRGRTKGFDGQDLGDKVEVLGPHLSLDTLRHSIATQIIDRIGSRWDEWYGALVAFKEQHGHCKPSKLMTGHEALGQWVVTQRVARRRGLLSDFHVRRLEELGFTWDVRDEIWEKMFSALVEFKTQTGNCDVPQRWSDNPSLGPWVSWQRQYKRDGILSKSQERRLVALGLVWNPVDAAWEEMFSALVQFKTRHGHCLVPAKWEENGQRLGMWVSRLRYHKHRLSKEQEHRLDPLGFVWDVKDARWEELFATLVEFKAQNGHCNVRPRENKQLNQWLQHQRTNRDRGQLSRDRIHRLEELGVDWQPLESRWEEMFAALVRYKNEHGHCNVPAECSENLALGHWVSNQRSRKCARDNRTGKGWLSEERRQRLEALGFVWDAKKSGWEKMFAQLVQYKNQHGHCNVKAECSENPPLGHWVSKQRRDKRTGLLSEDRQYRLETIGLPWEARGAKSERAIVADKKKDAVQYEK